MYVRLDSENIVTAYLTDFEEGAVELTEEEYIRQISESCGWKKSGEGFIPVTLLPHAPTEEELLEEAAAQEQAQLWQAMPARIKQLEEENMNLMLAAAESYEMQYNENMNLMLAVAELYEMMTAIHQGGIV